MPEGILRLNFHLVQWKYECLISWRVSALTKSLKRYFGGSTYSEVCSILFSVDLNILLFINNFRRDEYLKYLTLNHIMAFIWSDWNGKRFISRLGKQNWILLLVLFREKKKFDVWQLVQLLSPTKLPFWLNPSYYPFVTYVCHCNFPFQLGWLLIFPILCLNRCLTRSLCSRICCLDGHKHPAFSKLIVYLIEIHNCSVLWIIPVFPLSQQTPALFSLRNTGGLSWAEFM